MGGIVELDDSDVALAGTAAVLFALIDRLPELFARLFDCLRRSRVGRPRISRKASSTSACALISRRPIPWHNSEHGTRRTPRRCSRPDLL
jgi:hypothetical protein